MSNNARRFLAIALALHMTALAGAALAQVRTSKAYELPPSKVYQTFEALRGSPKATQGYFFAVSPDERWIATVSNTASNGSNVMTVVHAATGAKWHHTFTAQAGSVVSNWLPNCFSADSGSIVYGPFVAKLAEKMPELSFSPYTPDASELKRGTFLGFNGRLKNAAGQEVDRWSGLSQFEGEEGNVAWGPGGRVLYESATDGDQELSSLKRTPAGKTDQIDFSRLISLYESKQKKAMAQQRGELLKDKSLSADMLKAQERDIAQMQELLSGNKKIRLGNLVVAPNGQYLAGIASISVAEMGFGGVPYGVIIPLAGNRLHAFVFDVSVYGQMMWARDAKSLYFYSQSESAGGSGNGGGNGTVRKLLLSTLAIGAMK